jgi:hypothetical protein
MVLVSAIFRLRNSTKIARLSKTLNLAILRFSVASKLLILMVQKLWELAIWTFSTGSALIDSLDLGQGEGTGEIGMPG